MFVCRVLGEVVDDRPVRSRILVRRLDGQQEVADGEIFWNADLVRGALELRIVVVCVEDRDVDRDRSGLGRFSSVDRLHRQVVPIHLFAIQLLQKDDPKVRLSIRGLANLSRSKSGIYKSTFLNRR